MPANIHFLSRQPVRDLAPSESSIKKTAVNKEIKLSSEELSILGAPDGCLFSSGGDKHKKDIPPEEE